MSEATTKALKEFRRQKAAALQEAIQATAEAVAAALAGRETR